MRDAGLIGAAQRIEHYEIAGYGTARTFAERLGMDEPRACCSRRSTRRETDHRLTGLAEQIINPAAQRRL